MKISFSVPGEPIATDKNNSPFEAKWPISIDKGIVPLYIQMEGNPVAHERPRLGRYKHVYTPAKTEKYKNQLAWVIKEKLNSDKNWNIEGTFGVQALFFRSDRQRVDLDNLLKTVLDANTLAGTWRDDSQVKEISGRLFNAQDNPKVCFIVYPKTQNSEYEQVNEKYNLPQKCEHCGKPIDEKKSFPSSIRKYCSWECSKLGKRINITCKECGIIFQAPRCSLRKSKYSRMFCSRKCSIEYHSKLKRIAGKESDKWICSVCGGRVSRKEYKICMGCSMKTRSDPNSNYWKIRHKFYSALPRTEIEIEEIEDGTTFTGDGNAPG